MKKLVFILLIVLLHNTILSANTPHQNRLHTKASKESKPKKYISEWRKAQWRKAHLTKKKAKVSKKTKPKKYISEWRKAQWRKARLAKKKAKVSKKTTPKKYISKWRRAQWKKSHLTKSKKKRWHKKNRAKKLTKSQLKKLNRVYKKVAKKSSINKKALKKAFSYYKKNKSKNALSSNYLAIADYTKTAKSKRLFIINLKNGAVYKHQVAHGKYSGVVGGRVKRSSNRRNTKMTPYGFFKVGRNVGRTKKKGYKYLSVKGLNKSNRKVGYPSRLGGRDIVIHPAKYVKFGGRSHGCFAICPNERSRIFRKLKNALLYSYTGR